MRAVIIAALLAAIPAQAAETALADKLSPLSFLVGSCWTGKFADGSGVDTHCFTPMYGGRFVRDVHRVAGAGSYGGETVYSWDGAAKTIAYVYYNADGGVSRGTAQAVKDGLAFGDERYVGPDGKEIVMRSTWTRDGADGYVAVVQQKVEGGWREVMRTAFKRVPGPATAVKPE